MPTRDRSACQSRPTEGHHAHQRPAHTHQSVLVADGRHLAQLVQQQSAADQKHAGREGFWQWFPQDPAGHQG